MVAVLAGALASTFGKTTPGDSSGRSAKTAAEKRNWKT